MKHSKREKIALFLLKKSESARFDALLNLIERMIETEDVRYREGDDLCEDGVYWESCGESVFQKEVQ